MKNRSVSRWMPLLMAALIIVADQITKAVVVRTIEYHTIGHTFLNGFFRIIHTRNPAIAFSIGRGLPEQVRSVVFIIIPLALLIAALVYFIKSKELTGLQRWAVAGIIGGGFGNIIDRLFRPLGVVDFLDFKFYGLLGMERWPTFNVADSAVVVSGILMFLSIFFRKESEKVESF
jgi:signal peptidase II